MRMNIHTRVHGLGHISPRLKWKSMLWIDKIIYHSSILQNVITWLNKHHFLHSWRYIEHGESFLIYECIKCKKKVIVWAE